MRAATGRRIRELAAIIKADIREIVDADGRPRRIQDLSEELRLAIQDCEIDPITGRIRSVTLKSKIDAAEEYLRVLGEADKPEIVALIKAARRNQQRTAEIMDAMSAMRDPTKPERPLSS